jgi:hypothetical protein
MKSDPARHGLATLKWGCCAIPGAEIMYEGRDIQNIHATTRIRLRVHHAKYHNEHRLYCEFFSSSCMSLQSHRPQSKSSAWRAATGKHAGQMQGRRTLFLVNNVLCPIVSDPSRPRPHICEGQFCLSSSTHGQEGPHTGSSAP